MNYVYAGVGGIIVLFIALILQKKKKVKADYLLVLVNLFVAGFLVADVLIRQKLSSGSIIFQNLVPFLLFPTFVLYVLQFVQEKNKLVWNRWFLFIPAIAFVLYSFYDHFLLNSYPKQSDLLLHFNSPNLVYQVIFKGSQLFFIVILSDLLVRLKKFNQELKLGYSTIDTISVDWLMHFTLIYLGSIVLTFLLFLSQNLGLLPMQIKEVYGVVYGILILSVLYLNYHGIRHYTLAQVSNFNRTNQDSGSMIQRNSPTKPEQRKTAVDPDMKELEQKIIEVLETEKLYLRPEFNLEALTEKVGESRHTVSAAINTKAGRSFYDLINDYRVKHLKGLLQDPKNTRYTILALGLESGFNSKASINRIFKNKTGMTPKQFMEQKAQLIG